MPAHSSPAIEASGLVKRYGSDVVALDGFGIEVEEGSIFGLLGPNGAGKSTTVKVLTTLVQPDDGTASVAGADVLREPEKVRSRIGVVGQRIAVDPDATGRENLELQGLLYGVGRQELRRRMDSLFESFGLTEAAGRMARTYSGGMQRKLDVAMGLVHRPRVLFLDEPTTGLDPEARAELWAEIARLADTDGLTILLTTHYLEEADRLASRIAIVDRGRVVASGTPDDLKAELRGDAVLVELRDAESSRVAAAALAGGGRPGGTEHRRSRTAGQGGARGVGGAGGRLGPGARRCRGRIRHRRATLARRRVPAAYRPGIPATA